MGFHRQPTVMQGFAEMGLKIFDFEMVEMNCQ
jgi:hypothetical protein